LAARLDAALAARGEGYEPRTRHLRPVGSPVCTNRLILETSPYLLQHAHDPVNWYAWGDEAFAEARRLGRPVRDGAKPPGNSVALMNLLRLHELTADDRYREAAEKLLAGVGPSIARAPTAYPDLLLALDSWLDTPKEIVVVTAGPRHEAVGFLNVLRRTYLPNEVVAVVSETGPGRERHAGLVPWIRGKVARGGQATAYVCERGLCRWPTTEIEVFAERLERVAKAGSPATAPD
jgi:uncharacterized protein YyaL (SSP411 family)